MSIPSLAGLAVFVYGLVMMGEDQPTEADLSAMFLESCSRKMTPHYLQVVLTGNRVCQRKQLA